MATTQPEFFVADAVSVQELEVLAEALNDPAEVQRAAALYRQHGAIVVRGLTRRYLDEIRRDIENVAQQAIAQLSQAVKTTEGWVTPNGTLCIPAPPNFERDKQLMVLPVTYRSSSAFFRSAFDPRTVDLVSAILGPDVELADDGQCLYKEAVGGHPKHLHQDSAYFDHKFEGPVGVLNYAVDTDLTNGALHVVPGSHRLGTLEHVDTFSHLGLDETQWSWDRAVPLCGAAGDAIFFHYRTIHGSKENHSATARPVFISRYRRVDDYVTIGATTASNRKEAEARAEQARKSTQRGYMVCGSRQWTPEG